MKLVVIWKTAAAVVALVVEQWTAWLESDDLFEFDFGCLESGAAVWLDFVVVVVEV